MFHYSGWRLVAATSNAGMLGVLAPEDPIRMRESIRSIKSNTNKPFGVNIYLLPEHLVKNQPTVPPAVVNKLNEYRKELGLPLNPPTPTEDSYKQQVDDQLQIAIGEKVSTVVFTFGIPTLEIIDKLRNANINILGSATTISEAVALEEAGVDAVILQGVEAGGHRTSCNLPEYGQVGLLSLIQLAKKQLKIPFIAAGGITSGKAIRLAIEAGADGVSIGSLFLTSEECSTPLAHRKALYEATPESATVLTRVFTGRPARMFRNRFFNEMDAIWKENGGVEQIPWNFYARDIFGQAARSNNPDLFIVWANQSVGLLGGRETQPAAAIIKTLCKEC
ncbi:hypothetical protein HK103_003453 [Boothiomyces macroporosus]|uniref:2-nitropropane dioxygenase n=1 Tax=Boothiomyces macroporosus TaxID=261099 RepID=A0AAD5UI28_9FUNG|nr:hypothetical protein HK103_003453 [Boothiomyces macroporosus]